MSETSLREYLGEVEKDFQRIVATLVETIALMDQVDEVIEENGGWPIC